MSGKVFLDSNIFIYRYDDRDPKKQATALDLIRETTLDGSAVVSYQVIHEFFNFALVKAANKMRPYDAQLLLERVFRPLLAVPPSFDQVAEAIRIQERYQLSWYDSLILSAAQHAGCNILYTEDLQHGQHFGSLGIQNPFR
jgi:predicted nucleic acid-binding protein